MPTLYPIAPIGQGVLYAMAMPAAASLTDELRTLKTNGITHLVCLMEAHESSQLGLTDEETLCHAQGMDFTRYPIKDFGVPDESTLPSFIDRVHRQINAGAHLVVHCRGGIGRTGVVCCSILTLAGLSAEDSIKTVSTQRGHNVPETDDQKALILSFANKK